MGLTFSKTCDIIPKLSAAIAQSVERILGKDEVASSNLASSSKKKPRTPTGFRLSSFLCYMVPTLKTDTETDTGNYSLQNSLYYRAIMHKHEPAPIV